MLSGNQKKSFRRKDCHMLWMWLGCRHKSRLSQMRKWSKVEDTHVNTHICVYVYVYRQLYGQFLQRFHSDGGVQRILVVVRGDMGLGRVFKHGGELWLIKVIR